MFEARAVLVLGNEPWVGYVGLVCALCRSFRRVEAFDVVIEGTLLELISTCIRSVSVVSCLLQVG